MARFGWKITLLLHEAMLKKADGDPNWDSSLRQQVESSKSYPGKEPPFFASMLTAKEP